MMDLFQENATLREMLKRAAAGWAVEVDEAKISVGNGDEQIVVLLERPAVDPRYQATVDVVQGLLPAIAALDASPLDKKGQKEVSAENLGWMAKEIAAHPEWPIDKASRWLGFIQGVLAVLGFLSVKKERDRTRPLFHRAYELLGLGKPKSLSMDDDKAGAR